MTWHCQIHRMILSAVLAMLLTLAPVYAATDIDALLIQRFESMGADFSEPKRISFMFRVSIEGLSEFEAELQKMGYEVETRASRDVMKLVAATTTMQVTSKAIRRHRQTLEPLANRYAAIFDGWGTGFKGPAPSETASTIQELKPPCERPRQDLIEEALQTSDGMGHGPDIGSGEWHSVVEMRLGVRESSDLPDHGTNDWCTYMQNILATGDA